MSHEQACIHAVFHRPWQHPRLPVTLKKLIDHGPWTSGYPWFRINRETGAASRHRYMHLLAYGLAADAELGGEPLTMVTLHRISGASRNASSASRTLQLKWM